MAAKQFLVPFDERGNLQHYAKHPVDRRYGYPSFWDTIEWRPREEFTATLTIDHTISGMSAKYFVWKDTEGRAYPMFASDLLHLVQNATIDKGTVTGVWYPSKKGANFGVKYVREAGSE